jgi:hypothetical protein
MTIRYLTTEELREIFPTQVELIESNKRAHKEVSKLAAMADKAIDGVITDLALLAKHRKILEDFSDGKIVLSREQFVESARHIPDDETWDTAYTEQVETAISTRQPITKYQFNNWLRNVVYTHLVYGADGADSVFRTYVKCYYIFENLRGVR